MLIVAQSNTSSRPWCSDDVRSPYIKRVPSLSRCMIITHHWSMAGDVCLKNTIVKPQNSIGAPQILQGFFVCLFYFLTELLLYPFSLSFSIWLRQLEYMENSLSHVLLKATQLPECHPHSQWKSSGQQSSEAICVSSCTPLSFDSSLLWLLSWSW